MNFVVRSDGDAAQFVGPMRAIIRPLDPGLPVFEVSTLEHRLQISLAPRRFLLILMAALSALALLLGLVGIYGVISYLMLQRRPEFAIRLALGATNGNLFRLVLSQGALLTTSGLTAGLAASAILSRYVQHLLFNVTPNDPIVMTTASAVIFLIGLAACIVPARSATTINPSRLL